jgi:hypothetical protein
MPLELVDVSYAGEALDIFIAKVMTGFDSMNKKLFVVLPGIKKKKTIPRMQLDGFIQPRMKGELGSEASGTITVDARTLVTQDVMIFMLFAPSDFESHWIAVKLNPKLMDEELPLNAENAIMSLMMGMTAEYMEKAVWQSVRNETAIAAAITNKGFAANDNRLIFVNGLLVRMLNDAEVVKVSSPLVLTKANIFDELERVKNAVPVSIKENLDLKYAINPNTKEIFTKAQQGQNFKGISVTDAGIMTFGGKEIVVVNGLPDNTIVAGIFNPRVGKGNFYMGVNEVDEETYLKLSKHRPESEEHFIKGLFKFDVNYGYGQEIVLYTTWTPAGTYTPY